jgi:hypothetical protein
MMKLPLVYTAMLVTCSFGVIGCQKQSAEVQPKPVTTTPNQQAEPVTQALSIEEAQDDLVGNWQLDLTRSKSAGLKSAFEAKAKITMVMEPNGSRTLYRDGEPIEQGELILTEVKPDGELLGGFSRKSKAGSLEVTVRMVDENTIQWLFPGGQRTEVFTRRVIEPSPDFKD